MIILILSAIIFTVFFILYVRWMQVRQYWTKRKVGHIPPHPILGSLTFLQEQNMSLWMREMYQSFKTPYVGIWLFWRPALVINSSEIAKNILVKDAAVFRNRFASSGTTDPIGKLNLFTLDDPIWSLLRKRLTVLFTGSKLRYAQNAMRTKSKELVQRIEKERQKTKYFDLRNLACDYTTDVIGNSSFGVTCDATLTGESALRTITKEFMKFSVYRAICWSSAFFFPELVNVFRFKVFPKHTTEYLRKILQIIVSQRGGYETKVTEPRDLLDILIKLKQEDNGKDIGVTEDMLLAQAATFLQAGFESTATTITLCLYELAYDPEIQEKLYSELLEAKEKHGEDLTDGNILSTLTYLNCVIIETLRKYPPLGWLDRVATSDYKIDDHLTIAAGTPIYVNVMGIQCDPDIFPDPEKFDPDRFLPENEANIKPFAFLPFGEGPRKCIGERFGLMSARNAIVAMLLHYELKPIPDAPLPAELEVEKMGVFLSPGENVYIDFVPRI